MILLLAVVYGDGFRGNDQHSVCIGYQKIMHVQGGYYTSKLNGASKFTFILISRTILMFTSTLQILFSKAPYDTDNTFTKNTAKNVKI